MTPRPLADIIQRIIDTEEKYAVEDQTIRGATFKTFKNAPHDLRAVLDLCLTYEDAEFLVYQDERYTFKEVHNITNRIADVLITIYGIGPGDPVALVMRNTPEYPMLMMALASVGALTVCLNSWWTEKELKYGFLDCGASLAFVDEERSEKIRSFASDLGIKLVQVRDANTNKTQVFWDQLAGESENLAAKVTIDKDDDFVVLYTSGSTGYPKGVVLTHRNIASTIHSWFFGLHVQDILGVRPAPMIDETGKLYQGGILVATPFFHVSGTLPFFLALSIGGKLIILHKWDPVQAAKLVEKEKISRVGGVPTMAAELIDAATETGANIQSLRFLDTGGAQRPEQHPAKVVKAVPHILTGTSYGLTESGGLGITMRGTAYLDNPLAAGRPTPPLLEIKIVDEQYEQVPVGQVGELLLKSPANMRCYLNRPEDTAQTLRDGWLSTGDLAKIDEEGIVYIVDRKKNIIIRGGENISCAEVQTVLHYHPDVLEVCVFPIADDRLGETVGAAVFISNSTKTSGDELRSFLRQYLAEYKIPTKIWLRNQPLPRGASEKIDQLTIRAEYTS